MPAVLAIADDLTGALEAGAKFAARGIPAVVAASPGAYDYPVVVLDTESRHLAEEEAAAAIVAVAVSDARIIYKKTDSTLRGNIAAELRALASAYPDARMAYLPAYPALGRTVRNGRLYVDGVPVHLTQFAEDTLNPITESLVARLLGDGLPCTVHDSESDAELAAAVAARLGDAGCRILAGPASVAEEIAARIDVPRRAVPAWPVLEKCLVVNGSRHRISVGQAAFAERCGCVSSGSDAPWRLIRPAARPGMGPLEVAAETGRVICRLLAEGGWNAVMVFGGDTAFGVWKALGCPPLEPLGEIVTGAPVSRVTGRTLHLVTKAGGFGDETFICRVKQLLYENRRP